MLIALLAVAGACIVAWWLAQGARVGLLPLSCAVLYCGCAWLLWRWWSSLPAGTLQWDGAQWWLECRGRPPAPTHAPRICLDLQSSLLLRTGGVHAGACWLWLECGRERAHWQALRRALYASVPAPPATLVEGGR